MNEFAYSFHKFGPQKSMLNDENSVRQRDFNNLFLEKGPKNINIYYKYLSTILKETGLVLQTEICSKKTFWQFVDGMLSFDKVLDK